MQRERSGIERRERAAHLVVAPEGNHPTTKRRNDVCSTRADRLAELPPARDRARHQAGNAWPPIYLERVESNDGVVPGALRQWSRGRARWALPIEHCDYVIGKAEFDRQQVA